MVPSEKKKYWARTLRRNGRWFCYLLPISLMQTHSINFYWGPAESSMPSLTLPGFACSLFSQDGPLQLFPHFPAFPPSKTLENGEQHEIWALLLELHIWNCSDASEKRVQDLIQPILAWPCFKGSNIPPGIWSSLSSGTVHAYINWRGTCEAVPYPGWKS